MYQKINAGKMILIFLLSIFHVLGSGGRAGAVTLKVGVLAPEGTSMAENLKQMNKEIKKETDGRVKFKIYYGVSQGDEPNVLRRIRIGQLHGGIFTGKTLGEIDGDVRVMEIPFTFKNDTGKARKILGNMTAYFNKRIFKKNFINLGFFEIGTVYLVSKKRIKKLQDMKGLRIWAWEGDPIVESLIGAMKLVSIPLPLPEVLPSLSTGVVEAAYAPLLGIIALQWNTKIKYLLDYPLGHSIGAFLIDASKWNKISKKDRGIVRKITARYLARITEVNISDNKKSRSILEKTGVEFVSFPADDYQAIEKFRNVVIKELKGKLISNKALKLFEKEVGAR